MPYLWSLAVDALGEIHVLAADVSLRIEYRTLECKSYF